MADNHHHAEVLFSGILPTGLKNLEKALTAISPEHLEDKTQRVFFRLLERYYERTGAVLSESALTDLLRTQDIATQSLLTEMYETYSERVISDADFIWSVDQLQELYAEKAVGEVLADATEILTEGKADPKTGELSKGHEAARDVLMAGLSAIDRNLSIQAAPEGDVREEYDSILADYATRKQERLDGTSQGILTGIQAVDEKTGGFQPGELIITAGYSGQGKAQPLSAKVLTPNGFIRMGDIQVGTEVCVPAGGTASVSGVFPRGVMPVYRLDFSDGSFTEASWDHLWTMRITRNRNGQSRSEFETVTTGKLAHYLKVLATKPSLPPMSPVQFAPQESELPIDPYLLGVLLGDGGMSAKSSGVVLTTVDQEILDEATAVLPDGTRFVHDGVVGYRISGMDENRRSILKQRLRNLDLLGHKSETKFIPEMYLTASIEDRKALLQGLLDTDGSVEFGSARFHSSSIRLINDTVRLLRSLGLRAKVTSKKRGYRKQDGEFKQCLDGYTIVIGHADWDLFRLTRKQELIHDSKSKHRRALLSITHVRDEEVQCIMVDHPDHLYITDGFIPTHNTVTSIQTAWYAATQQGKNVVFFTTETLHAQIRRKIVARHSKHPMFEMAEGLNTRDLKSGTLSEADEDKLSEVVKDLTSNPNYGRLYVAQVPRGASVSSIEQRMYRLQRQFNIDFVVIDYLALLTSDRRRQTTREELAIIMKEAKQVASTFDEGRGVPIMSPWQIRRESYEQAVKTMFYTSAALSETAEATSTSDVILSILAPPDNDSRYCEVTMQVLKNRDGEAANGITVDMDYATCTMKSRASSGSFSPAATSPSMASGSGGLSSLL